MRELKGGATAAGVKDVDRYIAAAPASARGKLRELRAAVKRAAPGSQECISYRIPHYSYRGRLAWFGLFKGQIGLFFRPPLLEEHREELGEYTMTMSSLHLPLDREIPVRLVEKLVKEAVRKNEEGTG